MPYIPQTPKPSPKPVVEAYKQKKKRGVKMMDPKIDMYAWSVDPRRIHADMTRTR